MTDQVWVDVPGFEGKYQVTECGRVRSLERIRRTTKGLQRWPGRELCPFVDTTGYLYVNLSDGARAKKTAVHRIVLLTFVGPAPDGMQACHNDGNRENPALANLRWDTIKANSADRVRHGTQVRGERGSHAKLTEAQAVEIKGRGGSSKQLAKEYGVASSTIRAIRIGKNWRHL